MTWIKDHPFLVGLGAVTLAGMLLFGWYGLNGAGRYDEAKQAFDAAASEAQTYEQLKPYPIRENLESKKLVLGKYREATDELQKAFGPYRPEELTNISPQAFSAQLRAANEETRAAFGTKCEIPEEYFCGFENYKNTIANGEATGILSFQLAGVKKLMRELADAGASRLLNVHRPTLEEEKGQQFEPAKDQVARGLPLELCFEGSEKSVRAFLSSIVGAEERYYVIRSLRVQNVEQDPPKHSDAKFDRQIVQPATRPASALSTGSDFSSLFDSAPGGETEAKEEPAAEPEPAPVTDSSRILSQVLGGENLRVFMRVDIMRVLPAKELP